MEVRRYRTHDVDLGDVELLIGPGENGDWYVSIVPRGHKTSRLKTGEDACVRVTTSGERPGFERAANAVRLLYEALPEGE